MVSEREAEVISILSSFLLAVPPSPAGLAKLFLFESRLPEALELLKQARAHMARAHAFHRPTGPTQAAAPVPFQLVNQPACLTPRRTKATITSCPTSCSLFYLDFCSFQPFVSSPPS